VKTSKDYDFQRLASVDSTNSYAKRNCTTFSKERLTAIIADEQTSGRGRADRRWESPPNGSLYLTLCHFFNPNPNLAQLLSLAVHRIFPFLAIKWPNDLLLERKKVGGVLTEFHEGFAINGIGINLAPPSLNTAAFITTSREELLHRLIAEYQQLLLQDFSSIVEEYRNALIHKRGDLIEFHQGNKKISATYLSLSQQGKLKLTLADGEVMTFSSGYMI